MSAMILSIDPVGFMVRRPGQFNRYSYCYNDPVNCTDPTGMLPPEGTYSGELFSGHSPEDAAGIEQAFRPYSESALKGMVIGATMTPVGRGASAGVGLGARAIGAAALRRGASKSFGGASKYINSITSAGKATAGRTTQRIGTGGQTGAQKLFKTLTGAKGQIKDGAVGKLGDGVKVQMSRNAKSGVTSVRLTRKVTETGSRLSKPRHTKIRFKDKE